MIFIDDWSIRVVFNLVWISIELKCLWIEYRVKQNLWSIGCGYFAWEKVNIFIKEKSCSQRKRSKKCRTEVKKKPTNWVESEKNWIKGIERLKTGERERERKRRDANEKWNVDNWRHSSNFIWKLEFDTNVLTALKHSRGSINEFPNE